MEFKDINIFLRNHTGAEWFDQDLELFKKVLPTSKLIPNLENAQGYNKAELDERMCNELMSVGGVCDCTILENRGYTRDNNGFIVELKRETSINEFEKQLLYIDLDKKQEYNALKALIFGLGIHTKNATGKTYIAALKIKKTQLEEAKEEADIKAKAEEDAITKKEADAKANEEVTIDAEPEGNAPAVKAEEEVKTDADSEPIASDEKKSEDPGQSIQE